MSAFAQERAAALTAVASAEPETFGAGLAFVLQVRGVDEIALAEALRQDAAHRAALTSSEITHIGIGLHQASDGWLAVVALATLARPFDATVAAAQLLGQLNRHRRERGAAALRPDADLSRAAREATNVFLTNPEQDEKDLELRSDAELARFGLGYRKLSTLVLRVRDPGEASALEPALDAEASAVGVAIVETERKDIGAPSVVVVIVLGFDR